MGLQLTNTIESEENAMRERLLVCDSCGAEFYFKADALNEFFASGSDCTECGEGYQYEDFGWIEVSVS